jgi:hypothetical protein
MFQLNLASKCYARAVQVSLYFITFLPSSSENIRH